MPLSPNKPKAVTGWSRVAGLVLVLMAFLSFLPTFGKIAGFGFLPSGAWVRLAGPWALPFGVVFAALVVLLLIRQPARAGEKRSAVKVTTIALVMAVLGHEFVIAAGPMIGAMVFGSETRLAYTVRNAGGWGDGKCRTPIDLANMPLTHGRLCFWSEEIRGGLSPGQTITIAGRGTRFGLFPRRNQMLER